MEDNKIELSIMGNKIWIEKEDPQNYNNITIIPLKSTSQTKNDFLSLTKGFDLGLVEITECDSSNINKVIVKNNAVTPLLLIDGDEIIGAKQNRIINQTILIPSKCSMFVSVSCTERGRWDNRGEGNNFKHSKYFANFNTRMKKSNPHNEIDYQSVVWDSINELELKTSVKSKTEALNDVYKNFYPDKIGYKFKLLDNQIGLVAIINNEIKCIELFFNHSTYADYHDKLIKSYVIDSVNSINKKNIFCLNHVDDILNKISSSIFKKSLNWGIGEYYKFSDELGNGSVLIHNDEIIHMVYFKNTGESIIKKPFCEPGIYDSVYY